MIRAKHMLVGVAGFTALAAGAALTVAVTSSGGAPESSASEPPVNDVLRSRPTSSTAGSRKGASSAMTRAETP